MGRAGEGHPNRPRRRSRNTSRGASVTPPATLAAKGAAAVLGARRSDRIEKLAAEITEAGRKATAVKTYGRIDVLINNARAPLHEGAEIGHIINLSSVAGHKLFGGSAVYSATNVDASINLASSPGLWFHRPVLGGGGFLWELHLGSSMLMTGFDG